MEDSGSWIWDEYVNITSNTSVFNGTDFNTTDINGTDFNNICGDVTNHWLYFIFSGYLLPIISPRVRDWFKETINSIKNNKVGGHIVTLTEYGFDKIQDIENDSEMKEFVKRICKEKNPHLFYSDTSIDKISKLFSGKDGKQSWRSLLKLLNKGELGVKVNP